RTSIVVAALVAGIACGLDGLPRIVISRGTTYITSPLTPDGLPDYGSFLNSRGDTKGSLDENAVPALLDALGIAVDDATRRRLGDSTPAEDWRFVGPEAWGREFYDEHSSVVKPWSAPDAPRHAEWLAANEVALYSIVRATSRRGYWWPWHEPGLGVDG